MLFDLEPTRRSRSQAALVAAPAPPAAPSCSPTRSPSAVFAPFKLAAPRLDAPDKAGRDAGQAVPAWPRWPRRGLGAPPSPINVRIGPHRRFAWVEADLAPFKAIKDALGGTINDVVLTVVTGALRRTCSGTGATPRASS